MFTTVQPHEINEHSALIQQYFRLRKRVFFDRLNWSVPVDGDLERDAYDDAAPTYLLWTNPHRTALYGGLRLMPTTGPTLLHDVFHATHGRNPDLIAPDIWEGTRMCLDEEAIARDMPGLEAGHAFDLMFVALCEAALVLGIRRLVSNFEACMSRIYRRAGLIWTLRGQADGYGARPVYCADFDVSAEVLHRLRARHGLTVPLFRRGPAFRPTVPASVARRAAGRRPEPVAEFV
jgi:acyl homoserine lactone synthase